MTKKLFAKHPEIRTVHKAYGIVHRNYLHSPYADRAYVSRGDAVTGAATVISAMGAGKLAAKSINEALSK